MKKALVLSGGGYKGAFQAGVLNQLDWDFDAVFGTSVGSLNGLLVAQNDRQALNRFWNDVTNGKRFHKANLLSYVKLLFHKLGFYDNALQGELEKQLGTISKEYYFTATDIKNKDGELLYFGVSNAGNNEYNVSVNNDSFEYLFTMKAKTKGEISSLITASTCIPGIFEPINFTFANNDWVLVDGGIRNVTPLAAAIKWGAEHITIIDCSPSQIPAASSLDRIDKVILRAIDVMVTEINENDIDTFVMFNTIASTKPFEVITYQNKPIRSIPMNMYRPSKLLMKNSISPTREEIECAYAEGRRAKAVAL